MRSKKMLRGNDGGVANATARRRITDLRGNLPRIARRIANREWPAVQLEDDGREEWKEKAGITVL